ncbi:MAG: HU family DNA-binding protein [Hyphomicrobiales bacterium]|nr:HU family DNA-binding protein [Hyphomicrobiales bacterium]
MTKRTVTRVELREAVYRALRTLSRAECAALVDQCFAEITDALARGESVKLSGFAHFVSRRKAARIGRNPKTGVEAPISARVVVSFNPSRKLCDLVNDPLIEAKHANGDAHVPRQAGRNACGDYPRL